MQTMSTAMQSLLKSGKQIGDNRPTAEVVIGEEGFTFDVLNPDTAYNPHVGYDDNYASMVKLDSGNYLYMYVRGSNIYQSVVIDPVDLITQDGTIQSETLVLSNYDNPRVTLTRGVGDKLCFVLSFDGYNGDKYAKNQIFVSELGDGTDWSLFTTIQGFSWSNKFVSGQYMCPSEIVKYNDLWVVALPRFYTTSTYMRTNASIWTSTDMVTWTLRGTYTAESTTIQYSLGRNLVEINGKLLFVWLEVGRYKFYLTSDGTTWNHVLTTEDFKDGVTLFADSNNVYLLVVKRQFHSRFYKVEENNNTLTLTLLNEVVELGESPFCCYSDNHLICMGYRFYQPYTVIFGFEKSLNTIISKSITINRNKGMAGSLTLEFDNKSGILAPDGATNPALLWPNKEVVVKQGYGAELLKTFTGLIDNISMSRDEQGVASVTVSARDKLKVALDHLIRNAEFLYTLTYTNMLVEDIWKNLVGLAGLTYNTVEATGLTISEKTFSWETYADAFSWLDEIAGFETYCDEEGLLNFVWDGRPSVVTTAYSFVEGVDITRLGYEINDVDLYYTVAVYGKLPADPEVEGSQDSVIYFAKQLPQASYWNIPSGKVLRIDAPDADTQAKCEIIADKAIYLMQTRARQVTFSTIGIPHLQRGDFIQVEESSTTISEIYRITDITTQQGPDGYTMTLTCYYHSAPEVV